MDFMLGCNYWDSAHGTDMWKYYDEHVVSQDISALASCGIRYLRVFPNWRDFQPVIRLYKWGNKPGDCVNTHEKTLFDKTGVDIDQIRNFRNFANICNDYGIQLIVSIVTGWMSGRVFTPPIIDGKNPITDPEALMWTNRLIKGFVSKVKDIPNLIMWDLGNECNCMGIVDTREQSYVWTAFVRNAIRAEDPIRPISSGMHSLSAEEQSPWTIYDQGEITDYVTTHPYVSPTINNDIDPANQMRSTIFPTAQSVFYRDLGNVPVIMQEQNTFTETTANMEMTADFARVNIYSCLAHHIKGYFWWCGMEHIFLNNPPYSWSMVERSLGLLDENRKPKPVGNTISKLAEVIKNLPFDTLPEQQIDAVCVLTQNDRWKNGSVSFVLAKQAGLDIQYCPADISDVNLPDAPMYIIPGISKWAVMYKHNWDFLLKKVYEDGSSMLITYDGGSLIEFQKVFGLRSLGCVKTNESHIASFDFGKLYYNVVYELLLESTEAEILATNESANIVFAKHQYGKGFVYFLNMPLEKNLADIVGAFNHTEWFKIYKKAGERVISKKILVSTNPQIGVTLHKINEKKYIASIINYSDKTQRTCLSIAEGWSIIPIHGSVASLKKCDGAFHFVEYIK